MNVRDESFKYRGREEKKEEVGNSWTGIERSTGPTVDPSVWEHFRTYAACTATRAPAYLT
jgi:hypothetical protein